MWKNCDNCTKCLICGDCDKLINQTKIYASNPNEIKRQPSKQFGLMRINYKDE